MIPSLFFSCSCSLLSFLLVCPSSNSTYFFYLFLLSTAFSPFPFTPQLTFCSSFSTSHCSFHLSLQLSLIFSIFSSSIHIYISVFYASILSLFLSTSFPSFSSPSFHSISISLSFPLPTLSLFLSISSIFLQLLSSLLRFLFTLIYLSVFLFLVISLLPSTSSFSFLKLSFPSTFIFLQLPLVSYHKIPHSHLPILLTPLTPLTLLLLPSLLTSTTD